MYLLDVDFVYNNTNLYISFDSNFVTKELHVTNGMAEINHCVQRKFLYFKNVVRAFQYSF